MNPSKLADGILKRIEQEKISPRSRAYFYVKNISFWGLFALSILVGAMSFAVILYATTSTDFAVGEFVEENELLEHWLTLLPLLWVLLIGVAIGIGMVGLKHTKRGYRIALFTLIGSNILGSLALGGGLYAAGGGELIEEVLEEHVEMYEGVRKKHQNFWGNPEEKGRLAGRVKEVNNDGEYLVLEGPYGREWHVPFSPEHDIQPEIGQVLKMRGRFEKEGEFEPKDIRRSKKHEGLQRRIQGHLQRHPELRRQFESHLSPATRETLDKMREGGERPSPELREQIRQEVEANTSEAQRKEMRENVEKSIQQTRPPRAESALPLRRVPSELHR